MTPVITSRQVAERIKVLSTRLEKEQHYISIIKYFRKNKRKDINERLQLNWDRLYEFYPELKCIHNIDVFLELIYSNLMPNRIRLDIVGAKIYDVGSKDYENFLKQK